MGIEYKVRVKNTSGILIAEVVDFWELAYEKRISAPGLGVVLLSEEHPVVDLLAHKYQVEIWRRHVDAEKGIDISWYADFFGLYLDEEREETDKGIFTLRCAGQMWWLWTRYVMWAAGTGDRSKFISEKAETIMKTLVDYNAGSNATTGNGRERTGTITGISQEADGANGNIVDWYCAWENLLETLQELARVGGGDFDLIKTGAATWEFRWYTGQRGSDRSADVIFATDRGNMGKPRYRHNRLAEQTVAVVAGQGQGTDRETAVRTGTDFGAANDVELFVDARDVTTTGGLNARGDTKLDGTQAREEFTFDVIQTPATLYGEVASGGDYEVGDLVTARAFGIERTQKIMGATVAFRRGGRQVIGIETETQ